MWMFLRNLRRCIIGVDFSECPACGECYPDCGEFFSCTSCGTTICGNCERKYQCGSYSNETDFPLEDEDGNEISYDDDYRNCPYCNLTLIHQSDLFEFALEILGVTKEELENDYRRYNNKGKLK